MTIASQSALAVSRTASDALRAWALRGDAVGYVEHELPEAAAAQLELQARVMARHSTEVRLCYVVRPAIYARGDLQDAVVVERAIEIASGPLHGPLRELRAVPTHTRPLNA